MGAGSGERKVRYIEGFPCLVSPFLTGNPSKGEALEHLSKTAEREKGRC
jgi:hypothetical protein